MGLFGAPHGLGGGGVREKVPLRKICHTCPTTTMIKLGTVIPYLMKTQKIYKSRDKSLEFCWLTLAFFHRKLAKFVILRNTDIDCNLIHNFKFFY